MAGKYNLRMDKGSTKKLFFKTAEPKFDLAGWTSKARLMDAPEGNSVLLLTEGNGMTTELDGIRMEITSAQTIALPIGGYWAMEIAKGNETYRLVEGGWVCRPGDV